MFWVSEYLGPVVRKPVYAFVVHCLDSIIPLLAVAKISSP